MLVVLLALAAAAFIVKGRVDAANRGYSDTYGATVVHYSLTSKVLGRSLDEIAITPPGGGSRPLLVLLHGRRDPSRLSWLIPSKDGPESMLSDALLVALRDLGTRAPVVVLLNGGGHSYYHDRRDGRWASMLLDEAIPDAVRRFGTSSGRIAIGGVSMGGYGALHLTALRPGEFCAVGGHSAALWERGGDSAPGAFDDAVDFARNDVFAAVRRGRFSAVPVWIDVGASDTFHDANGAFASLLRAEGANLTHRVWPGGHTRSYRHAHMAAYLRFYASALSVCRP